VALGVLLENDVKVVFQQVQPLGGVHRDQANERELTAKAGDEVRPEAATQTGRNRNPEHAARHIIMLPHGVNRVLERGQRATACVDQLPAGVGQA